MKRRWFIRSIFMVPILLCVVGWGWSGTHWADIGYLREYHTTNLSIEKGGISIEQNYTVAGNEPDGWGYGSGSIIEDESEFREEPTYWPRVGEDTTFTRFIFARQVGGCENFTSVVGFELDRPFDGPPWFRFFMPFWFPIAIFSGLLFVVWRKTRKLNPATAFPVDVQPSGTA